MAVGPYWFYIRPSETTNLLYNPSGEYGTTGWGTIQAGTVGTTSAFQRFGAWAGSVAPTSNGTAGGFFGTATVGNGTSYTASAFVRGANGIPYQIQVETTDGATKYGSANFTGGGTWQRYWCTFAQTADVNVRVVVKKNSSADTNAFYVDGVQLEVGSLTTYCDGEQEGCIWLGQPHYSQSLRDSQAYQGGSIVSLQSIGMIVDEEPGIGMPPYEITTQSYALLDGEEYQRSRRAARSFALQATFIGTSQEGVHAVREAAIDAFGPDRLAEQQPVRFFYTGAGGTVAIDAVYTTGLEFNTRAGFTEESPVRFTAYSPTWFSPFNQGTSLAPRTSIGSANALVRRDSLGRWGTVGQHGTSVNGTVDALLFSPTGTLFAGGRITAVDGTTSRGLGMYFPSNGRWGSMGGTLIPGANTSSVRSLAWAPWGSLYLGGGFTGMSGTAIRFTAQWNGGYGSLVGGTVNGDVWEMAMSPLGTLFLAGNFLTANGTTSPFLAQWLRTGSMGTLAGQAAGTVDDLVQALAVNPQGRLYFTGLFGSAGGTAMRRVGQWFNGAFGTMSQGLGIGGGLGQGLALAVGANGVVYVGGGFSTAGVAYGSNVSQFNGVQWDTMGFGLGTDANPSQSVEDLLAHPANGRVYATGHFTSSANNVLFPDPMAVWTGAVWVPLDIDLPLNGGTVKPMAFSPAGDLFVGGEWTGTSQAASVAQIVNNGKANSFPTFRLRNTSASGTARIFQIANTLTDDYIYTKYVMQPGESAWLTLGVGSITFTSDFQGNLYPTILPGSNQARWRLKPGTNYVSFFSDSDSVRVDMYWRPRHDAADAGTVL